MSFRGQHPQRRWPSRTVGSAFGSAPSASAGATGPRDDLLQHHCQQPGDDEHPKYRNRMSIPAHTPAADHRNTWDHMLITGNTITGNASGPALGIDMELGNAPGRHVAAHHHRQQQYCASHARGAVGIAMNVGTGLGATNNQVLDTLIANNIISAAPATTWDSPCDGRGKLRSAELD